MPADVTTPRTSQDSGSVKKCSDKRRRGDSNSLGVDNVSGNDNSQDESGSVEKCSDKWRRGDSNPLGADSASGHDDSQDSIEKYSGQAVMAGFKSAGH